jgi:predicted Zn-dependent protease
MHSMRVGGRDRKIRTGLIVALVLVSQSGFSPTATRAVENDAKPATRSPSQPGASDDAQQGNEEAPEGGPLGALFGVAKRVAEQASRTAAGNLDDTSIQELIDTAADGVRNGLSVADDALPPLDEKTAQSFGDKFRKTLLSSHKRITDKRTISLVMPIWEEVIRASTLPANSVTITLIEDSEINAFAFVGKNVVMNRGFITFATKCTRTHEVIRFALAHELGHIACGHTDTLFRRMQAADKITPGASLGPEIVEMVIKQTPINQASEREADCFAREMHAEKGWSLEGGKEFLTRVQSMGERPASGVAIESLFASHPDEKRRLELLESGAGCGR